MKISDKGLNMIRGFEGLVLQSYKCPAGVWTIGYGHTHNVKQGQKINVELANSFLLEDLEPIEKLIESLELDLNQNQYDALCSWIFNLGAYAFTSSTLYHKIKDKDMDGIKIQWMRWINVNGKPSMGLKHRRELELDLFLSK